ncbi:hypothetical protein BBR47_12860 [Brevibacillus brevis NBRC 100599]|uniref:Uncharacterized protein n=1 Tax=Brevibacillus brevis (strain 47 / JCM 6285 / NBRC 100599) TaxID=358681 RepID=C0Z7M0_BREBN|nr:hypothetical protein BBR47_12860 [Brevibacillus brevis NBRC 100599]
MRGNEPVLYGLEGIIVVGMGRKTGREKRTRAERY